MSSGHSSGHARQNDYFMTRIILLISISTVFLTASFIGIVSFMSGDINNVNTRLPWYLVIGGLSFVGSIILLEAQGSDGRTIIVTSFTIMVMMFILTVLAIEGILFTLEQPELVFNSQLILYFFSAALVGVGIGYWGLKHWREFTIQSDSGGL